MSSSNIDSSGQMRGWFKLIETIRKTDPPSTPTSSIEFLKSSSNSDTTNLTNTNGRILTSPDTNNIESPPSQSPNLLSSPLAISLALTPIRTPDDIPLGNVKSTKKPTGSKRSSTRQKKITIRKSTRSKSSSTISNTFDDDILIDIHHRKRQSIDKSLNDSIIPLATELQSLPGHNQDESRDKRFLNYSDINTLSMHLNACLSIDKKTFSSSSLTKQRIFKTRHNILNKIFKLYYIKNIQKYSRIDPKSFFNKTDDTKSSLPSSTSISFKTDWSINRRSSSSHRHERKNFFHILQLNPKKQMFSSSLNKSPTNSSIENQQHINLEHIKNILARTYSPYLYTAIEYGYYFGSKSKIANKNCVTSTNDTPESSPVDIDETITLRSPPATIEQELLSITPRKRGRKPKHRIIQTKPLPITSVERRVSEEIPPVIPQESIVVSAPTEIPLIEKEINNNRKRKASMTKERKKKRFISSPSPEHQDISYSDSDEDVLPDELPKQNFIKNGLRSNYYKTTTDIDSKFISNKNRLTRRGRQSSGSLPPFYTGIFESEDEKSSYIDYHLPFDIFWFSQKQTNVITSSSSSPPTILTTQSKKKKSNQPKPKQSLTYTKILENVYTDPIIEQNLLSSNTNENASVCECKPPETCEDNTCSNRKLFTECLPICACGSKCTNQKIRKNQWFKHLEVFQRDKFNQGLRSTIFIPKSTFLYEYVGEIITDETFRDRKSTIYSNDEHDYSMRLTENLIIDAYSMGNIGRFVNHSNAPNCEFQKWIVDGLPRMCMFTLRSIKLGEELTYNHNSQSFDLQNQKRQRTIGRKQQKSLTNHKNLLKMEELTQYEKAVVLETSTFLIRNLRRVKDKKESKDKNNNQHKQNIDEQPLPHFFAQNYYHRNLINNDNSLKENSNLSRKDLLNLFYNHIRRSHFAKIGRCSVELIDKTCYFAQLAQLTFILNEIFDLVLNYKCNNSDIHPSNALKKCPLKRLFPMYYEIILKPIDLTIIRNKLDNGDYLSYDLFEQDLLLLFNNAITYCGEESDVGRAVRELQIYFIDRLKIEHQSTISLFNDMNEENKNTLEDFVAHLHEKEILHGQIRESLYEMIFNIDENNTSPIVYKTIPTNTMTTHRTTKNIPSMDCIVHCRCGSTYDEISLVQCYACQLWQHVSCVTIMDSSRPYYCFECHPSCEQNPFSCLKTNVIISANLSSMLNYEDNHTSYSTITRSDGFVVRINECYFVPKQEENEILSSQYDILCVERLWIDDNHIEQASGFYYIRPHETFHEANRKFFSNEVFRFPSTNDSIPISSIIRSCYVFDLGTYCKGKPISDYTSRILPTDLFICEYRVDKLARTFTRLPKSKHIGINTKSYCFDNYIEKLSIKRDYQPHEKEFHYQPNPRRRSTTHSIKLTTKQFEEKSAHMDGIIEKIYCRFHNPNLIPTETKFTPDQYFKQPLIDRNNNRGSKRLREKNLSSTVIAHKKRRIRSLLSNDNINEFQHIVSSLLDELIESILSQDF